ncbi:class I tRNA ligase family protein [Candidatus Nomurabacteria bacterium]|nr:class I tRNA ligase family protein [Candidatus Nomurabacteria bacterium]
MENNQDKNKKSDATLREESVLEFWRENKIFEKSLKQTEGKKEFIFFEGPPTANGKPGIHHLEARAFKDAIPRYKTMQGFYVRRKAGWDTHGLAVEIQTEKKLGLNSKKAIEKYGIAKFNRECKENVWEYLDVWNKFTERIGFWVDQENPYVTYRNDYIESAWNVLKKINDRNLLYKDYKVVPWCPRCGTALSTHELVQGYEEVKDLSVYVKFKVRGGGNDASAGSLSPSADGALPLGSSACETPRQKHISAPTFVLAWTTTPWTLPGNVALAVGKDIDYVKVKTGNEIYILAKERLSILTEAYEIVGEIKGKDLVGLEYEPLFPFLPAIISEAEKPKLEKAFKIYEADFVNIQDGTGIVHTAVMYGQDDFELGAKVGLPKHHLVNLEGKFIKGTGFLEGRFVKEKDENGKPTIDIDIIKYLTDKNLFYKKENYEHSYPHCWRCHTALIYYARDSWYIKMSDPTIKEQMIKENKGINWEPSYIQEGRFGEWLREIKDWAISRERYWGTPLPIWACESCQKISVIGSIAELKEKTKKSGNTYFVMRHGETTTNLRNLVSTVMNSGSHLTDEGKRKTRGMGELLKKKGIDLIFTSPFNRGRETAKIMQEIIGIGDENVCEDKRLGEMNVKSYEGRTWAEYHNDFPKTPEYFDKAKNGDESLRDIKKRMMDFLFELEEKYQNKKILIITHGGPTWLMAAGVKMFDVENTLAMVRDKENFHYLRNSEIQKLSFTPFPHDQFGDFDLHRPYIDEVPLVCSHLTGSGQACGGKLTRVREVMDVWFDSGCMPFAQDHYPFDAKKILYPADFISEAIDQTRGWFYTLHAIGVLMGRGKVFKNVICLGLLLDAQGKKMSKSLGNVVDPWVMMDKYGVDTLRLWMYSVNQPGESKNFDEKTISLLHQQVFGLLYNVLAFYELYRDKEKEINDRPKSKNILDIWILVKLDELAKLITANLDNYKLLEPTRALRDFIGDLSTWYLRRSRERIKEGSNEAKQTLYFVLKTLATVLAPFAPFAAEDIWLKLRNKNDAESVHLVKWPKMPKSFFGIFGSKENKTLENMQTVRKIVTLCLEARQKAGIKVRQPLASLKYKVKNKKLSGEYLDLIKDELNVKEIIETDLIENEVELDVKITEELKQEGNYRELARALQDMRKKLGLTPDDTISLVFEANDAGKKLIEKFATDLKKTVLVSKIEFGNNNGEEIKIDDLVFKIKIYK